MRLVNCARTTTAASTVCYAEISASNASVIAHVTMSLPLLSLPSLSLCMSVQHQQSVDFWIVVELRPPQCLSDIKDNVFHRQAAVACSSGLMFIILNLSGIAMMNGICCLQWLLS